MLKEIDQFLKQTEFFGSLSDNSRKAVADICLTRKLNKKEILFLEGETGFALYFCISGNIQLFKSTSEGKEIVIKVIKPGEFFGEVILFEESCYPVSAMAIKRSLVFMLPKHQFHCLLENEDFRNDFMGILMKKQRYLTTQIKYLTAHDVEQRFLKFLEEHFGRKHEIKPQMSKKDIANAIGSTPETFSRLLFRLGNENKLKWEGKVIRVYKKFWNGE